MNQRAYKLFFVALVLFLFFPFADSGRLSLANENTAALTLEESINFGLKNGYLMKIYRQSLEYSRRYVESTRAGLKSYFDLTANIPYFATEVEGIKDIDGVTHYAFTRDLKYQSTLSFHQPLPTAGSLSINYDFYYHKQKGNLINYSNDIFLRFIQPIFTSNSIKRSIRWAETNLASSKAQFIDNQFDYMASVIERFYEFYGADVEWRMQSEEIQQRKISYEDAKERFEKGELDERELLNLQVELLRSEADYYKQESNRSKLAGYFKAVIGMPPEMEVVPIANMQFTPFEIDLDRAIELGLENNPSVITSHYSIESQKNYLDYVNTWSEFEGYIRITYGFEKVDPIFRTSFNDFAHSRSILLNFSIPLWDWGRQSAYRSYAKTIIRGAELSLLSQQQHAARTIRNTVRSIEENQRRLRNLQNIEKQAQRSYELAREKFLKRELPTNELLLTMQQWSSARKKYIDAFIDYEVNKAQLERLTQWDFEKNRKAESLNTLAQL